MTQDEYDNFKPWVKFDRELSIKEKPTLASTKAIEAPIESFKADLYKPTAKMNAFRMKPDNVKNWLTVLYIRYCNQFQSRDEYHVEWKYCENQNEEVDEIFIQVIKLNDGDQVKLFTIKAYLGTHTVMVQGNHYCDWCLKEFPHLKALANGQLNDETSVKEIYVEAVEKIHDSPHNEDDDILDMEGAPKITEIKKSGIPLPIKASMETEKGQSSTKLSLGNMQDTFQQKISDISSSIKEVYNTLHKLETQYCDILHMKDDIESLRKDNKAFELRLTSLEKNIEDIAPESKTSELAEKVGVMEKQMETKVNNIENKLEKKMFALEHKMVQLKSNDKNYEECIRLEERLQQKEKENSELKDKCRDLEMNLFTLKLEQKSNNNKTQLVEQQLRNQGDLIDLGESDDEINQTTQAAGIKIGSKPNDKPSEQKKICSNHL